MSTSTLEALRALQTAPPVAAPPPPTREVLAGLAIVGIIAAAAITFSLVRESTLSRLERTATAEVDGLVASSATFGAALRTFGMTREPDHEWFARTSALVTELRGKAQAADAALVGIAMTPRAKVAESLQASSEAIERARANADADKDLMAQDVIQSNGTPTAEALNSALLALRATTADEIGGLRDRWRTAAALTLAAWALIWGLGLAWFARLHDAPPMPAARDMPQRTTAPESIPVADAPLAADALLVADAPLVTDAPLAAAAPEPVPAPVAPPQPAMRDSDTLADACETVAGLTDAAQIGPALQGIALALGASGLVLWLRDGDALAAAAAHGYPPDLPQRFGRVEAGDQNLIARAWQERASQTAPEAPDQRAAVASPIGTVGVVTGVLAAEFPMGRDADARAVATSRILAAQLSAVLGDGAATPGFEATGS